MSSTRHFINRAAQGILLVGATLSAVVTSAAIDIPNVPLTVKQSVPPLVMLVGSKDHRLFFEAYNDASDIDGDGTLDIRFKPSITYLGLFQSNLCYTHNHAVTGPGSSTAASVNDLFTPAATAGTNNTCNGSMWSGNWLNYVTTSRMDALRVVLYGGTRDVDGDNSNTVLERAYIPQDAHTWAKEYTSVAVDGYDIRQYTPLPLPGTNQRHFFGNLTSNQTTDCSTLNNCSNLPPLLRLRTNVGRLTSGGTAYDTRVWQWASKERPVLADKLANPVPLDSSGNPSPDLSFPAGSAQVDLTVRVQVCTTTYHDGCKQYPNGNWKPVGLLHDYGESESMLFGLLTGSYDKNMSGGRLRKVVSSFKGEVDQNSGKFTGQNKIVDTFDKLRIRDYNNGFTTQQYAGGWLESGPPTNGQFPDWGNPIGEMMYETVRYFAGRGSPTTAYAGTGTTNNAKDTSVGWSSATWDDPYAASSSAKAAYCARPNLLAISDVNISYDSDELPGTAFGSGLTSDLYPGMPVMNVAAIAQTITNNEPSAIGLHFIGEIAGAVSQDGAPTPKNITSLGTIRGLAPEEPTKQGSYYSAAVAYYAKTTGVRTWPTHNNLVTKMDTFVVALASPLPKIVYWVPGTNGAKSITLVPFAKSYNGSGIVATKGRYQPTDQIVDFYVQQINNSAPVPSQGQDYAPTVNGGRYYAVFRVNYEDSEQGADFDMDAIAEYTVQGNADGSLTVTTKPLYQAGGIQQRMGYVVSGTQEGDGVYLEVQDEADTTPYFLNTPPGTVPGFCDRSSPASSCNRLPWLGASTAAASTAVRTFHASTSRAPATLLNNPLWYAAKWGGFVDANGNGKPDLPGEWQDPVTGDPNTYLLVQNPLKLKQSLKKTLDNIAARSSSASNISANSTSISSSSLLFQAVFNTQRWSGDLIAYPALANGVGARPAWQAANAMPAWNSRKIFMQNASNTTDLLTSYTNLATADQTLLADQDTFDYLRGNRAKEIQNGGNFRDRQSALGDIVHSSPFFDKDTNVVYVGANDGMMHAISGANGAEVFAFIPRQTVARLKDLASPAYTHEYFVDGDMYVTSRSSLTNGNGYLYGLLGSGGKGLFSLDVTTPASFSTSKFLWEYTPAGSATAAADLDLGYMLGHVTSYPLNNGMLGVILGNGYMSTSGNSVLYIFLINPNGSINSVKKITAGLGPDNGLATPVGADTNNDGLIDVVYAGDLKGNVWKFDLSDTDPTKWGVALSGSPLFVAKDGSNNIQPITAPMSTAIDDRTGDTNNGKRFVFFGTGSYFKTGDDTDTSLETWYGIVDNGSAITGRSSLKQRTINQTGTFAGTPVRTVSLATANDMSGKSGWYLDFTSSPAVGERIVTTSRIIQFAVPALMASSLYPVTSDACVPGGNGFLNLVDPYTGAGLTTGVLDLNLNNNFTDDKLGAGSSAQAINSVDLAIGIPTEPLTMAAPGGKVNIYIGGSGSTTTPGSLIEYLSGLGPSSSLKGRISWREIVRD